MSYQPALNRKPRISGAFCLKILNYLYTTSDYSVSGKLQSRNAG